MVVSPKKLLLPRVCTLIAEVNDAGTEGVCFNQAQVDLIAQHWEEWCAAPQDDRLDEEPVFINS